MLSGESGDADSVWISDSKNRRLNAIKQEFFEHMQEISKRHINYYDFLLVAKNIGFRFEDTAHLMDLKTYFTKHNDKVSPRVLADCLMVKYISLLKYHSKGSKIVIKFKIADQKFAPIKEVTHEDEEVLQPQGNDYTMDAFDTSKAFEKMGSQNQLHHEESLEMKEKLAIILSIKVEEILHKVKILLHANEDTQSNQSLSLFRLLEKHDTIAIELFRKAVIKVIKQYDTDLKKAQLIITEDDIKALFLIIDQSGQGFITNEGLQQLANYQQFSIKAKQFYEQRINRKMVKNTLFKLGKSSNSSLKIYQLKSASVMEFHEAEKTVIEPKVEKEKAASKCRIPYFGAVRSMKHRNTSTGKQLYKKERGKNSLIHERGPSSSLNYYTNVRQSPESVKKTGDQNLVREKQKIEKIIRNSRESKKGNSGETIASKLRSLFIHKVILPRQKMLEQEKPKWQKVVHSQSNFTIKPS